MRPSLLTNIALIAISGYQRYLSPRKGFVCAYRVHTGGWSCSEFGLRAVRRLGLWQGIEVLKRRLAKCGAVHRLHAKRTPQWKKRAGNCDVPCDAACIPGDLPCDASCLPADLPCDAIGHCTLPGDCASGWLTRANSAGAREHAAAEDELDQQPAD